MTNKTKKVIILYTSGHLGSCIVFNLLTRMREVEVVGVIKSPPLKKGANISKHISKLGWKFSWLLLWQRVVQSIVYSLAFFRESKIFKPGWFLARSKNIPIFYSPNINDEKTAEFINKISPDLLISAFYIQILKDNVISLPKEGVLNIHPGWLPAFRGAMTYFWTLLEEEKQAGVSIHWIDSGIDTGKILARRSFNIKRGNTQFNVMVKCAIIGSRLLQKVIRSGYNLENFKDSNFDIEKTQYYPMPSREEFDLYFKTRRFFRIRDVVRVVLGK